MIHFFYATFLLCNLRENMKNFSIVARTGFLVTIFFMVLLTGKSLRLTPHHYGVHEKGAYEGDQSHPMHPKEGENIEVGITEVDPSGSSLPDCSHACGPCSPCKRVIVSFKCTESCPIVYRCMCKGKYYHVPSN